MKSILVIVSTYNGKKYLHEQLESIFKQKNVECLILVRDDGSLDGTQELLEKYKEKGKLEWYTGQHLNVSKSYFDLLIKSVEYDVDYIAFCDQDDVWDSDKLYIATEKLSEIDPSIPALYYCGQHLVDSKLNFIAEHILNNKRNCATRFVLSDFAGCTGVFNINLLHEVVKYEPSYMLMHDSWILKVCLCLGGKLIIDPKPHICYRQHGGNTVGLGRNFTAYLKQVKQYIFEYHVERQMLELIRGYGNQMIPEYYKLSTYICEYRHNKKFKKILLNFSYINFYRQGLNITYWLKVTLNKL